LRILSFIIPCYKSSGTIKTVIDEIIMTVASRENYDYEIILVNDCSPDNTIEVLKKLSENYKIKVIDLAKNFGQHAALMAGFNYFTGDVVICLDDDGQTPANDVFSLIDKLDQGYDVVYAKYNHKKHSFFRNFGSSVNELMARHLIGKPKDLFLSSYFVARPFVIQEMTKYTNPYPYVIGLVLRTTNKIANVDINHRERANGQSGYTLTKLLRLWFNGFTAFSVKPLRIATFTGCLLAIMVYFVFVIVNKIANPQVPAGWSSLMAITLLIGGIILFMLGLIGEYIGRIYISLNNSPQYVVKGTNNIEKSERPDEKPNI
jgi:glycosyltransferase involved in cell wall biosynthesis